MDNNEILMVLTITTLVVGVISLAVRYCFRSKCSDCNVCYGALIIHRDIEHEPDYRGSSDNSNNQITFTA
jgi:hypothetical protein